MAKTVRNVKNSLKFKAPIKPDIISVRVGTKKFTLPVEARLLASDTCLFLSVPAVSELFVIDNGELVAMDPADDATQAFRMLSPEKKKGPRNKPANSIPKELESALKSIPAGYKVSYLPDGTPKLVRSRQRRGKD